VKIVFINNLYPPYIVGGNEMLAREVIEALRGRGHTVHAITGHGRDLPQDGFTHGVLDLDLDRKEDIFLGGRQPTAWESIKRNLFNPLSYRNVRSVLMELKPDLIVAWNLWNASMAPLIAARRTGFPLVIHTADRWLYYGLKDWSPLVGTHVPWKRKVVGGLRRYFQPILYKLAKPHPIITISEFIRGIYIDAGFDGNQIETIHLGVPMEMFSPEGRKQLSATSVKFLYIGSLWSGKGPQVAIQALGQLVEKADMPDLHIDFYGKAAVGFLDYLKEVAKTAGVENRVTFHGFIDRAALPAIQRDHDILLFPSIWDEPFAAVPIEAMACGMTVIGTTAGGTPEAILHGETGLLIPPNDPSAMAAAMEELIRNPGLCWKLGQKAAHVARDKWTFTQYIDRLEKRYREQARLN
jgi:glycosyltransferase involved in cell wall biosynthesis